MKRAFFILMLLAASQGVFSQENSLDRWMRLTTYHVKREEYAKAIPYADSLARSAAKGFGNEHWQYALMLDYLARLYDKTNDYTEAEKIFKEATSILKRSKGADSHDYAVTAGGLVMTLVNSNKLDQAEPLLIEIKNIFKKKYGEEDSFYLASVDRLAELYVKKSEYGRAEPLFMHSLDIREKKFGEKSSWYALSLGKLGDLYTAMLAYDKAALMFTRAGKIYAGLYGEKHLQHLVCLNNIANIYLQKGEIGKAEPVYLRLLEISKDLSGQNLLYHAHILHSLANLYITTGRMDKAEPFYIQAREIRKNIAGDNSKEYASSLTSIANIYRLRKQYSKAEDLYTQAKNIREKLFGRNHPDYASSLNYLAIVFYLTKQYSKAESLYLESAEIAGRLHGVQHIEYADKLNNLGLLYSDMEKYDKAEKQFLIVLEIYKRSYGENHPRFALILKNLGGHYMNMKQYKQAEKLMLQAGKIETANLKSIFMTMSEKEKEGYLGSSITTIAENTSLLYQYPGASPGFKTGSIDLLLFYKAMLLTDSRRVLDAIMNSKDTGLKKLFENWQTQKRLLAREYSLPLSGRRLKVDSLEALVAVLEKDIFKGSAAIRDQKEALEAGAKNVAEILNRDEACVEFIRFKLYNKSWTDSVMYGAYVLRRADPAPIFIPLFEEKQLQIILDSAGKSSSTAVSKLYRGTEIKDKSGVSLGKELYKLIWAPLEPYLNGIKVINYSPDGKLYGIAFHALPVDSNTLLMDRYRLGQYTSTRQVAWREGAKSNNPKSIALFGDADFSMDSLQLAAVKKSRPYDTTHYSSIYSPASRGNYASTWPELPGTAEEVQKISRLFETNRLNTKTFTRIAASEENLKSLNGNSPQVLHIATHGFFLPEQDKRREESTIGSDNTYSLAEDPLLRSGLILSGGNYAWSGKSPIDGVEDGIATAYEISQLNFSNTELVVLSACETALGDVKGSEGVFGLQRAFKMAGVKKMIVSLWQVPDKETAELMNEFYTYWLGGKTIEEAFAQAQAAMRKKYAPYYWAAFVLVE